jgi:phosphoribosylanthranilate isomerase
MFHVKICGVMTPADARMAADAGADAIGLNFVAGSPRCLDVAAARRVAEAVPAGVLKVGVFAGMAAEAIRQVAREVGLDAIQLHGHLAADPSGGGAAATDPPERCGELAGLPVIRAVRLEPEAGGDGLAAARAWIAAARNGGAAPVMAIVDAAVAVSRETGAGALGGTGAKVDWQALARARPLDIPTALAGGLTPDNVAEAIRQTGIHAVDTASGVESSPGVKDAAKVRAFVKAALGELGLPTKYG